MKLDKFELDKKLSVAEMKQVKAGSVSTTCGGRTATSNVGWDSDSGGNPSDLGF
jgi:hypothetical protein